MRASVTASPGSMRKEMNELYVCVCVAFARATGEERRGGGEEQQLDDSTIVFFSWVEKTVRGCVCALDGLGRAYERSVADTSFIYAFYSHSSDCECVCDSPKKKREEGEGRREGGETSGAIRGVTSIHVY